MSKVFIVLHMAWATRGRMRLIPPQRDAALKTLLNEGARRADSTLLAIGITWDHVHVIARVGPRTSVSVLAQHLKGFSSHEVNASPSLSRGLWWQAGYFAESIGAADIDSVIRYVNRQREHHDDSHALEHWLSGSPTKSDF